MRTHTRAATPTLRFDKSDGRSGGRTTVNMLIRQHNIFHTHFQRFSQIISIVCADEFQNQLILLSFRKVGRGKRVGKGEKKEDKSKCVPTAAAAAKRCVYCHMNNQESRHEGRNEAIGSAKRQQSRSANRRTGIRHEFLAHLNLAKL